MERLPDRGIYLLLIYLPEWRGIKVGSLGEMDFQEGYYVYVGSAQRNLKARIERHMKREKRLRWHVDYLLEYGKVVDFFTMPLSREWEERIAKKLCEKYLYVSNFGSSDSRAPSHLIILPDSKAWKEVLGEIRYMEREYPQPW